MSTKTRALWGRTLRHVDQALGELGAPGDCDRRREVQGLAAKVETCRACPEDCDRPEARAARAGEPEGRKLPGLLRPATAK